MTIVLIILLILAGILTACNFFQRSYIVDQQKQIDELQEHVDYLEETIDVS